jgi:uroporphyrinogen decarboxylase
MYLGTELVGWENYLAQLIINQKFIEKLTDLLLEWQIKFFTKLLGQCGKYTEIVWLDDDWGQQSGPIMNPELFRKLYKPRLKLLVEHIKSKTDAKICLHSCGSIYWAMQDFIDVGIDAINPVQVSANEMDTHRLKTEFGDQICFWGGACDTQRILPFGNIDDVEREVEERVSDLKLNGGFVAASVHNIQAGVPPENIVTFFKSIRELGTYT